MEMKNETSRNSGTKTAKAHHDIEKLSEIETETVSKASHNVKQTEKQELIQKTKWNEKMKTDVLPTGSDLACH